MVSRSTSISLLLRISLTETRKRRRSDSEEWMKTFRLKRREIRKRSTELKCSNRNTRTLPISSRGLDEREILRHSSIRRVFMSPQMRSMYWRKNQLLWMKNWMGCSERIRRKTDWFLSRTWSPNSRQMTNWSKRRNSRERINWLSSTRLFSPLLEIRQLHRGSLTTLIWLIKKRLRQWSSRQKPQRSKSIRMLHRAKSRNWKTWKAWELTTGRKRLLRTDNLSNRSRPLKRKTLNPVEKLLTQPSRNTWE